MGFKLPGKSIQSGTSSHSSALKMKMEANAAAKYKKESMAKMYKDSPVDKALVGKQENLPEDLKAKIEASPGEQAADAASKVVARRTRKEKTRQKPQKTQKAVKSKVTEPKGTPNNSLLKQKAYGGDRSWETAQKQSKESGGDLNQTTRDQKAYEKQKKAENPNWNKREDNQWKKRQNTINAAVGSKKVYKTDSKTEVIKDEGTKERVEAVKKGEEKMAKKGPTEKVTYKKSDGTEVTEEKGGYKPAYKTEKKLVKSQQKEDKKVSKENIKSTERGSEERKEAKSSDKELRTKQERERRQMKRDQKANKLNEKASKEGASKRTKRRAKKATERADELASRKDYKKTKFNPFD